MLGTISSNRIRMMIDDAFIVAFAVIEIDEALKSIRRHVSS